MGQPLDAATYELSQRAQQFPLAMLTVQDLRLTPQAQRRVEQQAVAQAIDALRVAENEHRARLRRQRSGPPAPLDAKGVWNRVLGTINQNDPILEQVGGWQMDKQAEKIFRLLCLYHARDPRFEKDGLSLAKGIILAGNIGAGKTTMLQAFRDANPASHDSYGCVTAEKLVGLYTHKKTGGKEALTPYTQGAWMLDDVGREIQYEKGTREVKDPLHFGVALNVIEHVIDARYSRGLPFNSLHMTMNLDLAGFRALYGPRAYSRVCQSMNIIQFDAGAFDRRTGLVGESITE